MSYLFENTLVWSNGVTFPGEVLVEGNKIRTVAGNGEPIPRPSGVTVIDGSGCVLMPGLVDGHGHLGISGSWREWGFIPTEEHVLRYMHNARTVLDAGFTGVISGGAVKPRLDIVIRNEIDAGRIPGPRLLACSPEMTCTGGLGDDRLMHLDMYTYSLILDGPEEFRKTTRLYAREGADLVKVGISGNPGLPHAPADATLMTEDELAAVTGTAHSFGMRVAAHARSNLSVVMALNHDVELIYHCENVDERTLDLLEAAKDRIFLAPAFAPAYARHMEMEHRSDHARDEAKRTFDAFCTSYTSIHKRGIKVLIGGEYGLPEAPHGTNARDMGHFVEYFGYSNTEALVAATKWGAEAMLMGHCLGEVKPGYLADLLLVKGRPDEDVRLLEDRRNLMAIMKDGAFHKQPVE